MAYKKISVDNTICSRRFHLAYDDASKDLQEVKIKCPHCEQVVFQKDQHPEVGLIREENLVTKAYLSDILVDNCKLKDDFPPKHQK